MHPDLPSVRMGGTRLIAAQRYQRRKSPFAPPAPQVSCCALRRDQHASTTGLRVPPQVMTTNAESVQQLEQLFREFDVGALLPQASAASSESIPMTVATDNSARHHRAAYEARKILPRVSRPKGYGGGGRRGEGKT